ncbi:MAG: hypothetical protein DME77_03700 [Verrucomicrobia bacterium]|nr:MAG: hypothetical protein DME77_03700 [Verrucomicrobiota bacterium]
MNQGCLALSLRTAWRECGLWVWYPIQNAQSESTLLQSQTAGLRQFTTPVSALSSRSWRCKFKLSHYRKNRSAELLQTTLDEESETNETLNQLAEGIVNPEALMETEVVGAASNR